MTILNNNNKEENEHKNDNQDLDKYIKQSPPPIPNMIIKVGTKKKNLYWKLIFFFEFLNHIGKFGIKLIRNYMGLEASEFGCE